MKKGFLTLVPDIVIRRFFKMVRPLVSSHLERVSGKIPENQLDPVHLKEARLVVNREELLKLLPKNGVVAELGVDEGQFSEMILRITKPKKLHLIDFWGTKRYNLEKRKGVEDKFSTQIKDGSVEINLGFSTEVVKGFQDDYFDWIYIDTTHSYELTIAELESYNSKVKKDGIIAGHDYVTGNWEGMGRYGVIEAVYEFCVKHKWQIIYLSTELETNPSFAIKRINTDNR